MLTPWEDNRRSSRGSASRTNDVYPACSKELGGTPHWNMSRVFQGIPRCSTMYQIGTTLEHWNKFGTSHKYIACRNITLKVRVQLGQSTLLLDLNPRRYTGRIARCPSFVEPLIRIGRIARHLYQPLELSYQTSSG